MQDEDMRASTKQLVGTPRGIVTIVVECLSYVAMLPFLYIEAHSIEEYREDWLNAWNVLDIITYLNQASRPVAPFGPRRRQLPVLAGCCGSKPCLCVQTAILVMHLSRWAVASNTFSVLCAIQVLLLWVRLQYFARVLQPTRQPFMETLRAVLSEVSNRSPVVGLREGAFVTVFFYCAMC